MDTDNNLEHGDTQKIPSSMLNVSPTQKLSLKNAWQKGQSQVGPVIGIIIIVIVLALGGLYVWGTQLNRTENSESEVGPTNQTAEDISQAPDPTLDNLQTQSTSDELDTIEDDLDTTSLQGLDAEMNAINVELQ